MQRLIPALAACGVGLALLFPGRANADLYLTLDNFEGDSDRAGREGAIDVDAFGIRAERELDSLGRPNPPRLSPMRLSGPTSSASPLLFQALFNNTVLTDVELVATDVDDFGTEYDAVSWLFSRAIVVSYAANGDDAGLSDTYVLLPTDEVTYTFTDESGGETQVAIDVRLGTSALISNDASGTLAFAAGTLDVSDLPLIQPIPEPAGLATLALAGVVGLVRRRR